MSWWLEIEISRAGDALRVTAQGNHGQQPAPHLLEPRLEAMASFAEWVEAAAERAEPLDEARLCQARALHRALFREGVQTVLDRMRGAAGEGQGLVRLMLREGELQAFPWEALCAPGTQRGFLGNSPDLFLARGVSSADLWQPREVSGAVKLQVISPTSELAPAALKSALHARIATGELEWLEPLTGPQAGQRALFEHLRGGQVPHVLHFICHGAVDEAGTPRLRLADVDGEECWVDVELLAQQLKASFRGNLRLVVLEACEGARPGALASAAELLARAGADAVVAHLWPVKADVARLCSSTFYRALTGAEARRGDVAYSLSEARRMVLTQHQGSAEAFSPVLYLRGRDATLFDFKARKVGAPHAAPVRASPLPASLRLLLNQRFSLLLGDRWSDERSMLEAFRVRLRRGLEEASAPAPAGLSMSALAQRYAFRMGKDSLDSEFQDVFGQHDDSVPIVESLAKRLGPGVHVTLLRRPVLELALARQRPDLTLYVVQPPEAARSRAPVMRRAGGQDTWEPLDALPTSLDLRRDVLLLRLYRGYLPRQRFEQPFLTEDDYLLGVRELESMLSHELSDALLAILRARPVLLLGMSMLTWHHRMMLYRLFEERPLPRGSLALLEPGESERELWVAGASLPGRKGVQVVETDLSELVEPVAAPFCPEAA
ncbi:CHAT domain-containing protein [Pyxidicoccus xibeiensis]|uniref:CHAT domain-containing protein n=1 Tax=Pyxidicoccus xibeiensis TaxID=2906759 RepID=UPI0020A7A6C5|nr:CHAT domain-containing protein [Pyxidicoccus xibeiensis]MCP3139982.1 CHAT domain-containing protein [Pyxidicoccus xibeiensis]